MTASLDLDAFEERAFRSRFDDGLLDVLVGAFVLLIGATFETDLGGLGAIWAALLLPLWMPLRRRFIEPRMGFAKFTPARRRRIRWNLGVLHLTLGVSVLAGLGMWAAYAAEDASVAELLRPLGPTIFHGLLALMIGVGAATAHLRRGLVYAALVIGLGAGFWLAGLGDFTGLTVAGALITAAGAVRLVRFVRDHPLPPSEDGEHDAG